MTAEEFIALLDRTIGERGLIPMAELSPFIRSADGEIDVGVVLTQAGVDRIADLIRDIEQVVHH